MFKQRGRRMIILLSTMLMILSAYGESSQQVDYVGLHPDKHEDYSWSAGARSDYTYDHQERMLKRGGGRSSGSRSRSSYSSSSRSRSSSSSSKYSYSGGRYSSVYGTSSYYGFSSYYRRHYTHFYYYSAGQACYPEDYECINEAKVDYTALWIVLGVCGFCCCCWCVYYCVKKKKRDHLKRSDTDASAFDASAYDQSMKPPSPRKNKGSDSSSSSDDSKKKDKTQSPFVPDMTTTNNQPSSFLQGNPLNAPPIYQGTPVQQPVAQMHPMPPMQPVTTTVDASHPAYLPEDLKQQYAQNAANNAAMMSPNGQQVVMPPMAQQPQPLVAPPLQMQQPLYSANPNNTAPATTMMQPHPQVNHTS